MKCTMIIMRPKADTEQREVEFKQNHPSLNELRALIEPIVGDSMEHVSVLYENKQRDMFVNEDGHRLILPLNPAATRIYHAASIKRGHKELELMQAGYFIVGPAVLFTERVWF